MAHGAIVDSRIRVIADRLADGRELFYFDDVDSTLPATRRADARELDPRPATARMRFDVLAGEWVSIATARQTRVHLPPAHLDPLAPQTADNPSEIPDLYDVAVFENKSPSFGPEQSDDSPSSETVFGQERASVGRCEVVCFSPEAEGSLGTLGVGRIRTVVEAWAHRTHDLYQRPGIEQVFVFENRGVDIGVTLHHPHGQIYGYPFATPRTQRILDSLNTHGSALYDGILEHELAGSRILYQGEHFVAFVPFAARWPVEIQVLPLRHINRLDETTAAERAELAMLLSQILPGLDALYGTLLPYMAGWHQAPKGREDMRLMLTIYSPRRSADKLKFLAGSEAVMGAWVSDVSPENAAAALRDAIARQGE